PSPTLTPWPSATPAPTQTPSPTATAGPILPTPTPPGQIDTGEPNDDWTLATPLQAGIHQSFISYDRDVDWFKVHVEKPGSVLRITMPHPPADYDLALLSDPAGITSDLADIRALIDLGDVDQTGALPAPEEIGDISPPTDARAVRDISTHPGHESESVESHVLDQSGWYYVLVTGYNGAYDDDPYTLEIEIEPPEDGRRCTVELPHPPGVITARWTASEAPATLILVNKRRMDAYFGSGSGSTEEMLSALRELAGHAAVNGVIEPVENNPEIAAAYSAWDEDACNPEAANRVTEAIKRHIDDLRDVYPTIRQVLIIGNDDIIPFHRVPDETHIANESQYLSQINVNPNSPFYAALAEGYILTDDFYVDDAPLGWRGRRLFVPDRPVGRLVETPQEIISAVEAFLEMDGRLDLHTGLVLGYDFSSDGTTQIADLLSSAGITVDSLVTPDWTGADMRDSLLNAHHDVNVVNARFTHDQATSPDKSDGPLTAEAVAEVGSELRGSLILSIGSHAGLSVPDHWATAPDRLDFSQAFCNAGSTAIANTGYGYGVVPTNDYSELLMTYFVQMLTQMPDVTVGTALVQAKQRLIREAGPASFSLYHEKALIETTLFGVPGLRITVPNLTLPSGNQKQVTAGPMEVAATGLYRRTLTIEPDFERVDTSTGSYFKANDGTISRPGRPVQPRFTWGIREPEMDAHGALWVAATYTEFHGFDPVVTHPVTDTAGTEPAFPFSVWSPARLHAVNRFQTASGLSEHLVVVPGQYRNDYSSPGGTAGVERRYDSLTYHLYYSTSDDWRPPTIWQVRYEKTALGAEFWVDVTDASGVERVVVTYTRGDGTWVSEELQHVGGISWQALLPYFETDVLDFVAQAVDGAGNVAMSVDRGRLFGRRSQQMYLSLVSTSRRPGQ
ncbi:MAG: hypothetical protein D6791_12565, partial [Chloroflexi bacterium]